MSFNNRVVWSEGLFLRPQHFQQHDRYVERFIELRSASLRGHSWGFTEVQLERELLGSGKLALKRAAGVFPDGTPFSMPEDDPLPPALELSGQVRDKEVVLAIPIRKDGARESDRRETVDGIVRYRSQDVQARDVTSDVSTLQPVEVASVRSRLLLAGDPRDEYSCIPLTRVVECGADRKIALDEAYIPTMLNAQQAPRLATFLTEIQGLLHHRGEALAGLAVATGRSGSAEISDYLMLQAINRYEPVINHLSQSRHVHPEDFYRLSLEIVGDLSTLATEERRPPKLPIYEHEKLKETFEPLMAAMRRVLSIALPNRVVQIPIEKKRFNISVAVVNDRSLFDNAAFVLAARADVPAETVRRDFPAQATIASTDTIAKRVNEHLPGVPLQALPVAPRQIPFHAGFTYFELDRNSPLFREIKSGGAIAMHVPDTFPGLAMEMWAIRG